jgi:hypothetical protein
MPEKPPNLTLTVKRIFHCGALIEVSGNGAMLTRPKKCPGPTIPRLVQSYVTIRPDGENADLFLKLEQGPFETDDTPGSHKKPRKKPTR